jgi:soluble lytic murein transglycosylase-like protein
VHLRRKRHNASRALALLGALLGTGAGGSPALAQDIPTAGAGLVEGQAAQAGILGSIAGQINANVVNAIREAGVARMQDRIASSQPVDQNGNQIRLTGNCTMTSATGAAGGIAAGNLAGQAVGDSIESSLDTYNTGAAATPQPYISALASMPFATVAAANVIGDPNGAQGTGSTYNPQATEDAIHTLTNPFPLLPLPSNAAATPAGQKYTALSNLQQIAVETAQDTLNEVSTANAPLYPLGTWEQGQMANISSVAPSGLQQPISNFSTAASQTAAQQQIQQSQQASAQTASTGAASCNSSNWQNELASPAIAADVQQASAATGIPAAEIAAIMSNESAGGSAAFSGQNSSSSATGPMQMENGAAEQVCQTYSYCPAGNSPSTNAQQNIMQGAYYLEYLNANFANGNPSALAVAYNEGPGYVANYEQSGVAPDPSYVSEFNANLGCPGSLTTPGMTPALVQAANGNNPAAPTSGGARIAMNTLYWTLDMQRFGNPTWWQGISTSSSEPYLWQQIVEMRGIIASMQYQTDLFEQRIAALTAISQAQSTNQSTNADLDIRNAGMASSISQPTN